MIRGIFPSIGRLKGCTRRHELGQVNPLLMAYGTLRNEMVFCEMVLNTTEAKEKFGIDLVISTLKKQNNKNCGPS